MAISARLEIQALNQYLTKVLGEAMVKATSDSFNRLEVEVLPEQFQNAAGLIHHDTSLQASFTTMLALEDPIEPACFKIHLLFLLKKSKAWLTLSTRIKKERPVLPAISPLLPAAQWFEREIHDLFGIQWAGISLEPLVLHRDWPRGGHYPLRKDFPINQEIPIAEVSHQFHQPHAEGMHQVAVGPIHAAIIEPGHMRFCVTGEQVHHFDAQLFYTHKGIEKMAEGKEINQALTLAEHVCGLCAFSHSTAFCQAIEALGDIKAPERAVYIRTICLELERLNSHMADLSAICASGGYGLGSMQASRLREQLMQLTQHMTGHRFFRGLNAIGGLNQEIPEDHFAYMRQTLEAFQKAFKDWHAQVMGCDSFLDRIESSGYLSLDQALNLGLVGPPARGSGIERDVRVDFPYAAYTAFQPKVSLHALGDVFARTSVRIDEVYESLALILNLIQYLPKGSIYQKTELIFSPYQPAFSVVESAKGDLVHWVMLDPDNRVYRWHVRSASYMNWRGMVTATMGNNIVPDGPLVNKSFNLCYACVDR